MNDIIRNQESEQTIRDWLSAFLWHWQDSPILPEDAAVAIMGVLRKYLSIDEQTSPCQLPDQEVLLKGLGIPKI